MDTFKVITFTHKNLPLEFIGSLHLSPDEQQQVLGALKVHFGLEELLFLSTCNRVEVLLKTERDLSTAFILELILFINSRLTSDEQQRLVAAAEIFTGDEGVEHLLRVASSLDSLVVGEREIITQVRKAYDYCNDLGLTGDFIRLLIRKTIETAKDVYTHTDIAKNPVSVASLAYRQLRELGIKNQARIVFVGSGETNTILANYFQKHEFANFTVFNRTLTNAQTLAAKLRGESFELSSLPTYDGGFDVLVVCTASSEVIITDSIYAQLTKGDNTKKVIIDLGVPANVHPQVAANKLVHYIDINSLKARAEANLQLRRNEIQKCEEMIAEKTREFNAMYDERKVELAFGEVPKQVKAIKDLALNEVFAKEINRLDDQGKEVLEKVLTYMEKKYNAVAIKTAKEVFLSKN